jgi:MFS family permease
MTSLKSQYEANIWKLYLVRFIRNLHFFGAILIPFFTDWGGLNMTQILLLQSIFMLSIFVFEIPTGAIGDRYGRKFSIGAGSMITVLGVIFYIISPNFWLFAIAEIFWGLSSALISGSDEALLYDSLVKLKREKESKEMLGRHKAYSLMGIVISSLIGAVIASQYGLRAPLMLSAVFMFFGGVVALTLKEVKIKYQHENYKKLLLSGIQYFREHKILRILTFDMLSIAIIAYFMIWFWQKLFINAGVQIIYFGAIQALFVLIQVFILRKPQTFERLFGSKKNLLTYSALICGVFFIIGGLTSSVPILLLVVIIGGGFGLARAPLYQTYFNKYIPSNQRATVLSTIAMVSTLGIAIANPIMGYLADWSLSYAMIILGVAAISLNLYSKVEENMLVD